MVLLLPSRYRCPILSQIAYLLYMHALQTNVEVGWEILPRFMPLTMFWSVKTLLTFKCLSRRCQSSTGPPLACECTKLAACTLHTSVKVIWYKLPSYWVIATTSPFAPSTMHLFMRNCTFNPFHKSLLTKSKSACNLGTWSTSVMGTLFFMPFVSTPTTMDPIPMASAMLSSPKRTLHGEITS